MRVSAKELYGLRAMSEFARNFGQGPLSLSEVAKSQGISQAYLEQIAIDLRRVGSDAAYVDAVTELGPPRDHDGMVRPTAFREERHGGVFR